MGLVSGSDRIVRVDKSADRLNFERSKLVLDSVNALVILPFVLNDDRAMTAIGPRLLWWFFHHNLRRLPEITKQCGCLESRLAHINI